MRLRTIACLVAFAFCCASLSPAKSRKDVPIAPLPAKVLHAKKIFITNGGGNDLAYDAFYAAVKDWGHYQIVDTPADAEVVFDLRYVTQDNGVKVWSSTSTYDGTTQVHSRHMTDPQLILTIVDGSSKDPLWSTVEHRRLARLERNREKETVNAAQKLVDNLKLRLEAK